MNGVSAGVGTDPASLEDRVAALLDRMSLAEKIGQMSQVNVGDGPVRADLADDLRQGRIGSVLNAADPDVVRELQRISVNESRLGIPLLVGRDVIHGFRTVFPIPFGQAASWNPDVVSRAARIAAGEAAQSGINWTFAPMIDVSRDPRWGRIAESFGEDPFLTSVLGAATVRGLQGNRLDEPGTIAACGKHFAGYGAAESGRDYAATNLPENELRNVYLRPFRAAIEAGVCSLMTSFSDIDGIPATANQFLLREILRDEWRFDGVVVSDWDSVRQLSIHGLTANDRDAAREASLAGVDMEMHGDAYRNCLQALVDEGLVDSALIDLAAANILRLKFRLGLFEQPNATPKPLPSSAQDDALAAAREAALQSVVLLKNDHDTLPLAKDALSSIAVIGPLADAPRDQLGTWIFDGDPTLSITPLQAIREVMGPDSVHYAPAMETSRSRELSQLDDVLNTVQRSDAVVMFLGEEAILSGEAHSRADIRLPGAQTELVKCIRATGKPLVAVILAGRPLVLSDMVDDVDAILFAGHPGTMAGPAIADLLFGVESPSGKLPATFPRMVGQVPIYYAQKNTGKPPSRETAVLIDDIDANADQLSTGLTAYHLDAGFTPLFPFGFGLSYSSFEYSNVRLSSGELQAGDTLTVDVELTNNGDCSATEIAQLYVRDLVGSVTRPVRELKGFKRVHLAPGERVTVTFTLHTDDFAFYGRDNRLATEPGDFHLWVGGDSNASLMAVFSVVDPEAL